MSTEGYLCRKCGKYHEGPPLSYGSPAPVQWFNIPAQQRSKRVLLSSDQCEIDGKFFYIVGNLDIPIMDSTEVFRWSVWVSLSGTNYERARRLWQSAGREKEPPYFGWLSTALWPYPDTLNLKVQVHTRPVGIRPSVELEPTDHPLAVEQRNGITMDRVREIAEIILHAQ